jgi:hypothetical protein
MAVNGIADRASGVDSHRPWALDLAQPETVLSHDGVSLDAPNLGCCRCFGVPIAGL